MRKQILSINQRKNLLQEALSKSIELGFSSVLVENYTNQLKEVSQEIDRRAEKKKAIKENGGISIL